MRKLRASEIYRDTRHLLIAAESVSFQHYQMEKFSQMSVKIEPIAVVVCSSKRSYALDMEAKEIALEQLKQHLPELDDMMASING